MFELTNEQIEKAIEWWANAIVRPVFDGLSNKERQDPRNEGYQMAEMLATVTHKEPTSEQLEAFKVALRNNLEDDDYIPQRGLHVDYGPDLTLGSAAKDAGINVSTTRFPWKTNMWFYGDGRVGVSAGYRAPTEYL